MKKSIGMLSLVACLALATGSASAAAPAPAPAPAAAAATQPLSKTVGVDIVKLTPNADKTVTATFRWKAKSGDQVERNVILNSDTVISIGGKVHPLSDVTNDAIRDKVVAMVGDDDKTAILLRFGKTLLSASADELSPKQAAALAAAAPKATAASDASYDKRAGDLAAALHLDSPEREARVKAIVLTNLVAVRDAHNAWMSPSKSVREKFNADIAKELTPKQIDALKDAMTGNEIKRHWDAYHIIAPGLNAEEDAKIISVLREGREALLNVKNQDEHGRTMEPFKTEIEQYLTSKGHDWKVLYKENSKKVGQAQTQPMPPVPPID